jgi:hypothetical protein
MSTKAPKDLVRELERINSDMKRIAKMSDATKNMLVSTVSTLATVRKLVGDMSTNIWNGRVKEKDVEQSRELDDICSLIDKTILELKGECEILEENLIK